MIVDSQRKGVNSSIRFVHLALQIIAGFWAVVIDGYPCQEQFIRNVTYFAYAMLGFNLLLLAFFNFSANTQSLIHYLPSLVNLGLCGGMLYYVIEGYNKYNTCAQSKALYEFFFIEIIIALVLFLLIMVAKVIWADRYAHWVGNLAWPILFLKWSFPGALTVPALVIGIIFAVISFISFLVNVFHYTDDQIQSKGRNLLTGQWSLSMILMLGC